MSLLGRGSSKDLYSVPLFPEAVAFEFSDRVSVFDYGALADAIPGKGKALERSALHFFRLFEKAGLKTAFDAEASEKNARCVLRRASHPKFPGAEASPLKFIPLEVIFRWGVVPGASLLKRDPSLKPYQRFEKPLVEFSTKLESSDRMVNDAEAAEIAGDALLIARLRAYAETSAKLLRENLKGSGLELWDGKIECAVDTRTGEILLVDALTLDEMRVTIPGLESIPLSKELLRQWLGSTLWAWEVGEAKKSFGDAWRSKVSPPPRLGAWRLQRLAGLYDAFAKSLELGKSVPLMDWARGEGAKPKVFVMGTGGRETALRWRLSREGCEVVDDPRGADAVWISQDADLADGVVDRLDAEGVWTYGPRKNAAKLEWSKAFGREIAAKAGVASPGYSTQSDDLRSFSRPPVVKYDGLAAGKGVVVPKTWEEAESAVQKLGTRGSLVLEEQLTGFEASAFFAVETGSSGVKCRFLGTARDFKRRYPHDEGPNTGGMGAHAPHAEVTAADIALFSEWARATALEVAKSGVPFRGILYLGLLKDKSQGWKLLEYNARFGDPETQALMLAWPDAAVLRPLLQLDLKAPPESVGCARSAVCLALVRQEYPEAAPAIEIPSWDFPEREGRVLFRSGSLKGRVAYVVGAGQDLLSAGDAVFEAVVDSPWKNLLDWRADILP
jgi:phosphoribosylamine--glycine ligase